LEQYIQIKYKKYKWNCKLFHKIQIMLGKWRRKIFWCYTKRRNSINLDFVLDRWSTKWCPFDKLIVMLSLICLFYTHCCLPDGMLIKRYLLNFNFGLLKVLSLTTKGLNHQHICLQLLKLHLINFIKKQKKRHFINKLGFISTPDLILVSKKPKECGQHNKWATSQWRINEQTWL
jgi:hypothetical protein